MNLLAASPAAATAPPLEDCAVVELRDYLLHPGRRDDLIDLFEREFVETQEATGMRVLATFRDLDRPEHFVWMRGFTGMPSRRRALDAFYGGPVWQAHREAANATMIDSSDVLLLRPAKPAWAANTPSAPRPRVGEEPAPSTATYVLCICRLQAPADASLLRAFERDALPALRDAAAMPCAVFVSESSHNDFPRLPVRTDGQWLAWLSRQPSSDAWTRAAQQLHADARWARAMEHLQPDAASPMIIRRLQPTARSLLR